MPYLVYSPSGGLEVQRSGTESETTSLPAESILPPARRFKARRKASSTPITIFPRQRRFAVVKMDPVAMVTAAGLDDAEALAAAKELKTKKYLVYLESAIDLPVPDSEWCRYCVNPIATTLRAESPVWGVTADMVVPIPPNTAHFRAPNPFVDDKDPEYVFKFPFKNCYFWAESDTELRIRIRRGEDGHNDSKAIMLALRPHLRLLDSFIPDLARMSEFLGQPRDTPATHTPAAASEGTPSLPPNPQYESTKGLLPVLLDAGDTSEPRLDNSIDNSDLSETLEPQPSWMCPEVEELFTLDLFGWHPNPATKYIPLVDCWLDLEEHLSESTIPSPVDLWTEQQRIGAIINAAIERRNASRTGGATQAPLAPASPSTAPETTRQPPKKSKWRKLFVEIVSSGLVTLTKLSKVPSGNGESRSSRAARRRTKVLHPTIAISDPHKK